MRGGRTYLFVLCPAFSGSTVLYRLIGSSRNASTLFGHSEWAGEGQFVPAVRDVMRRQRGADPRVAGWEDPAVEMPWELIRREWERCWDLSKPVLVEKSPPNVLRAPVIEEHFSRFGEVRFVAMVRSPYHVRQKPELWIAEALHQRRNIETLRDVLWTTYEELCADPEGTARRLSAFVPALGELDPDTGAHRMADEGTIGRGGRIVSRNGATRSLVEQRNRELAPHQDLLRFFGYELLIPGTRAWDEEHWLPEIEIGRCLSAPPAAVFRAWIEPALLERWWGGVRVNPKACGAFSLAPYPGAAEEVVPVAGRYLDVEAPRRLRFTWGRPGGDYLLDDSTVEVELGPAPGGGTALVLRSLAVGRSWYEENRRFWASKVEDLARVLAAA